MLAKTYRFIVKNSTGSTTGATDSITITRLGWKLNSSGVKVDEATATTVLNVGASLANLGYAAGATIDNTVDLFFGGTFLLSATLSNTPAGNIDVWYQISNDGGTTWPDNGKGEWVGSFTFSANGTQKLHFEL